MHHLWQQVFLCESCYIEPYSWLSQWINLLFLYVVMHAVRFICLGGLWPLVNMFARGSYAHDVNELGVMWFSGLRGAVGLSLALEVGAYTPSVSNPVTSVAEQQQILFYVCGGTALTLIINASLIKPLIQWAVPTKMRSEAREHYYKILEHIKDDGIRQTQMLACASHGAFYRADWWEVRRITFLHSASRWEAVVAHVEQERKKKHAKSNWQKAKHAMQSRSASGFTNSHKVCNNICRPCA